MSIPAFVFNVSSPRLCGGDNRDIQRNGDAIAPRNFVEPLVITGRWILWLLDKLFRLGVECLGFARKFLVLQE